MRLYHSLLSTKDKNFSVLLPANCKIVGLVSFEGSVQLVMEASPQAEKVNHKFCWVRHNEDIPNDGLYIGTILGESGFAYETLYKLR